MGQEVGKEPRKTCDFSELKDKSEQAQLTKNDMLNVLQHMENRAKDVSKTQELKQDRDVSL